MKKFIILIAFACLCGRANAQIIDNLPWCPPGATWVYSSYGIGANLYYKFTYEKDTLISSHTAKLLAVYQIIYTGGFGVPWVRTSNKIGQEYMYKSNDSVYWYDDGRYKFIYSFAPAIGSNYEISNSRAVCNGNPTYPTSDTISVTGSVPYTVGGRTFTLYTTSQNSNWQLGRIIKNIGGFDSPFPQINRQICSTSQTEYGHQIYNFLECYSDSLRGSIVFNGGDCYDLITSTYESPTLYKPLFTYPNPVADVLHIDMKGSNVKNLVIYDILGNIVLQNDAAINEVSLIHLPAGVYIIRATNLNDDHYIGKIIKK